MVRNATQKQINKGTLRLVWEQWCGSGPASDPVNAWCSTKGSERKTVFFSQVKTRTASQQLSHSTGHQLSLSTAGAKKKKKLTPKDLFKHQSGTRKERNIVFKTSRRRALFSLFGNHIKTVRESRRGLSAKRQGINNEHQWAQCGPPWKAFSLTRLCWLWACCARRT